MEFVHRRLIHTRASHGIGGNHRVSVGSAHAHKGEALAFERANNIPYGLSSGAGANYAGSQSRESRQHFPVRAVHVGGEIYFGPGQTGDVLVAEPTSLYHAS